MTLEAQMLENRISTLENRLRDFYERLDRFGLEWFRKFYGIYRGQVMDNRDPLSRGRVLVAVPDVGHTLQLYPQVWIDPIFVAAGTDRGLFCPPEIGDSVRVFFEAGDAGKPMGYLGGWHGNDEVPEELAYSASTYPERRGFVSRLGHAVWLSDEPGKEEIHLTWHKADASDQAADASKPENHALTADRAAGDHSDIAMGPDGSITATNKNNSSISLDATNQRIQAIDENKNVVTMDGTGVTIVDKNDNKVELSAAGIKITDKNGNYISLDGTNGSIQLSGNFQVQSKNASLSASGQVSLGVGAAYSVPLGELLIGWLAKHTHLSGAPGLPTQPPLIPPTQSLLSSTVKTKE
jgi:hypothetical protein